jgi:hypothetical protein
MKLVLALLAVLADADSLDRIVADTWQYRLDHQPALRLQQGLPVESLPEISEESSRKETARIWELRRKAERELGPKFDLRRFHEAVLGSGSLPLSVLERHVEWWIGQEKAR